MWDEDKFNVYVNRLNRARCEVDLKSSKSNIDRW
jgi:hypothetical protein